MSHRPQIAGLMLTMTTYGTWLRGDRRGWVEKGRTLEPAPRLVAHNATLLKHSPFHFSDEQIQLVGNAMGRSLIDRAGQRLLALAVQHSHVHVVVSESDVAAPMLVKCAKDAVRYALRLGRPIWTEGYDQRFCFGVASLRARIEYVERHNSDRGLPPRPWPFIDSFDE